MMTMFPIASVCSTFKLRKQGSRKRPATLNAAQSRLCYILDRIQWEKAATLGGAQKAGGPMRQPQLHNLTAVGPPAKKTSLR